MRNLGRLTFSIKASANVLELDVSNREFSLGNLGGDYMIPVGQDEIKSRLNP